MFELGEKVDMRKPYATRLRELAKEYDIFLLDADLGKSAYSDDFKKEFPDRYGNCGISESAMQSIAAGLALAGFRPVTQTFAMFAALRGGEQIRQSACYAAQYTDIPIVYVGLHGGIWTGEDGVSHQATEDIALMRAIPHISVYAPSDANEVVGILEPLIKHNKPVYLRLVRGGIPIIFDKETMEKYPFGLGKSQRLREHEDPELTLMSYGATMHKTLEAYKRLKDLGINCNVVNMSSIKPFDKEAVIRAAIYSNAIVVIEDHQKNGGLSQGIAGHLSEIYPTHVKAIALDDTFAESGGQEALYKKYGLDGETIAETSRKFLESVKTVSGKK
ncbi:MAG: transketolase C-terminal domain-containing protein [Candidatus Aenigmatarchaeota archaeon]